MSYKEINDIVSEEVKSLNFEKVSDLTKDEFTELLSNVISKSIKSSVNKEFIVETITDELGRQSRT